MLAQLKHILSICLGGIPHICGGYDSDGERVSECIRMSLTDFQWSPQGSLPDAIPRSSSGYDHSAEWGLVISGGYDDDGLRRDVFQTKDGSHFEYLPSLPEESAYHCLTIIDDTRLLVAGGDLTSVYIYDATQSDWIDIGALPSGRRDYPACGVVRGPQIGRPLKVVIAGVGTGYEGDIYDLEANAWQDAGIHNSHFGPRTKYACLLLISANVLPIPIYGASSLPHEDSFIIIGGSSDGLLNSVYKFETSTESFVLMEGVSMEQARGYQSAMYVDVQALPKCD